MWGDEWEGRVTYARMCHEKALVTERSEWYQDRVRIVSCRVMSCRVMSSPPLLSTAAIVRLEDTTNPPTLP